MRFSYWAKVITVSTAVVLVLLLLYEARDLLRPFLWAAIAAYVFNPVVGLLCRRARLPRLLAVALLYIILLALLAWWFVFVIPPISREVRQLGSEFPKMVHSLYQQMIGQESLYLGGFEISPQDLVDEVSQQLQSVAAGLARLALPVFLGAIDAFGKTLLFLLTSFYLLLEADRLGAFVKRNIPAPAQGEILSLAREIDEVLNKYVRGQLILVAIMSTLMWVALTSLQVRYALLLAIASGILEIFPYVGPVVAGAIACTVGFFQPNPFGWSDLLYVAVIAGAYTGLRYAEDYFIIPNVLGRIVKFHPLLVIFIMLTGGVVAGILGMLLAVPVMAVAKILGGYLYGKVFGGTVLTVAPAPHSPPQSEESVAQEPVATPLTTGRNQ